MKRLWKIAAYLAVLCAALALVSCGNLTEKDESSENSMVRLCLSVNSGSSRTILPTDPDIGKAELLAKASGSDTAKSVKTWTTDETNSAIEKMTADTEIFINTGTYDFTLNLYSVSEDSETLSQTGTLENKTVSEGSPTALAFTTTRTAENGNLSLKFTWTEELRVWKLQGGLYYTDQFKEIIGSKYLQALPDCSSEYLEISGDAEHGYSATYEKTEIPAGNYIFQMRILQENEYSGETIGYTEELVIISGGCTTSKTIELSLLNTRAANVFHLNGGAWDEHFGAPVLRNVFNSCKLPKSDNVIKEGYSLVGWYDNENFQGEPITVIPAGSTETLEFWARWGAVHNLTLSRVEGHTQGQLYVKTPDNNGTFTGAGSTPKIEVAEGTVLKFSTETDKNLSYLPGNIKITVVDADGNDLAEQPEGYPVEIDINSDSLIFTMPDFDIKASIGFYEPKTITIDSQIEDGTVSSSLSSAIQGNKIALTVTPNAGYTMGTLSVKAGDTDIDVTEVSAGYEYTFIMPDANVTVSATFINLTPFGTKQASEGYEVGDIVFRDGTATPYTEAGTLTDEQKAKAVAVIFYKGTGLNSDDADGNPDNTTVRTVGVALSHTNSLNKLTWCSEAYDTRIESIECVITGSQNNYVFTGDKNGSDNIEEIETVSGRTARGFIDGAVIKAYLYSAGAPYKSGWYLPSIAELYELWKIKETVSAAFNVCGGTGFADALYWSATPSSTYTEKKVATSDLYTLDYDYWSSGYHRAWCFDFKTGRIAEKMKNVNTFYPVRQTFYACVCPIREF